ncbi:MAG: hypothetical protein AAGD11_18055 [Planctomycetota bacterium]
MGKKSQLMVLAAIVCVALASQGFAQSATKPLGFGTATTQNLLRQNSAARFSSAQIQQSVLNQSTTSVGSAGVNQKNFLNPSILSSAPRSKPFSAVTRGPTVSPYLALSAPRASASDYYNVIRPQQQQQAQNQRQQLQAIQQQRRLNQLAARAPFSTTGDENSAPTGHAAVFQSLGSYQNTGGYFPPPSQPKRQ